MIERMTDEQYLHLLETHLENIAKERQWRYYHPRGIYPSSAEENRVYFDWCEQKVLRFEPEHMQAQKLATIAAIRAQAGV